MTWVAADRQEPRPGQQHAFGQPFAGNVHEPRSLVAVYAGGWTTVSNGTWRSAR
jgi:hypothetical protein